MKGLFHDHALSGCDTMACYSGVGKGSVVKTLKAGYDLFAVGSVDAQFTDIMEQVTRFVSLME